jgi:hypothetical protein
MKTILTSALVFVGLTLFAQTPAKTTTQSKPTSTTATTATTELSPKAKALCKEWVLTQTELFGDLRSPDDIQKNDKLILMENGRYRLIYNNVAEGGTWTLDKTNTWITLTKDDGTIKKFKVLETTDKKLKIDYRDADDIHNVLIYSPAVATTQTK